MKSAKQTNKQCAHACTYTNTDRSPRYCHMLFVLFILFTNRSVLMTVSHTHMHTHAGLIYMCEAMCPLALLGLCNPLLPHVGLPDTQIFCSRRLSERLAGCLQDFARQDLKWCNKSVLSCVFFVVVVVVFFSVFAFENKTDGIQRQGAREFRVWCLEACVLFCFFLFFGALILISSLDM